MWYFLDKPIENPTFSQWIENSDNSIKSNRKDFLAVNKSASEPLNDLI